MTQSTANNPLVFAEPPETTSYDYPVKLNEHIYDGDALSKDATTGNAHQLVTNEDFLGFARHEAQNATNASPFNGATVPIGAAVEGGITVCVRTKGQVILTVAAGGALNGDATDKDKSVYASDSATFTGSSAGNNVKIGTILDWISGTTYLVGFQSTQERNK